MKKLFILIILTLLPCISQAEYFSIGNAGFETPVLTPAGATYTISPWLNNANPYYVTDTRIYYPTAAPVAYDGNQVSLICGTRAITQDLSNIWTANTKCIFSPSVSRASFDNDGLAGFELKLLGGATVAASAVSKTSEDYTWRIRRAIATTGSSDSFLGQPITVSIGNPNIDGGSWLQADGVKLLALPIPGSSVAVPNSGFESVSLAYANADYNLGGWNNGPNSYYVADSRTFHSNGIQRAYEGANTALIAGTRDIYRDLGETYAANKVYTVLIEGIITPDSSQAPNIEIGLFNSSDTAIKTKSQLLGASDWKSINFALTTGASDSYLGNTIRIKIKNTIIDGGCFMEVDDVSIFKTNAQNGTWAAAVNGNWWDSTKWSGNAIAAGAGYTASFNTGLTADTNVDLGFPVTIGNLSFTDSSAPSNVWTISKTVDDYGITLEGSSKPAINVVNSGDSAVISAELLGSQGFSKTGNGTLILTGSENINLSGDINVDAGALRTAASSSTGYNNVTVANGAALELATPPNQNSGTVGSITISGNGISNGGAIKHVDAGEMSLNLPITLVGNASIGGVGLLHLQNTITGNYDLTKVGNGYLFLDANSPDFTGNFTVAQGVVRYTNVNRINNCASLTVSNGAELQLDCNDERPVEGAYSTDIAGAGSDGLGALKAVGASQVAWSDIILTGDTTVYAHEYGALYLGMIDGPYNLIKLGSSLLDLELGSPTFSGNVICKEGRIQWRHFVDAPGNTTGNTTLWNGTQLNLITDQHNGTGYAPLVNLTYGESLVVGGGSGTGGVVIQKLTHPRDENVKDTITGSIALNTSLVVDVAPAGWERAYEDCVTLSGTISGIGDITKTGAGVLEITGNNSRTGNTTINAGTLRLTGTNNKLPNNGILEIASGAKVDLGSGVNETVGSLVLGGVVQTAGTYNASNTPAYFTGSGSLIVSSSAVLTGTVTLGSWTPSPAGTTVTVDVGATAYPATLDADGKFMVSTPGTGTYAVRVKASHWLAKKQTGVVVSAGSNTIGTAFSLTNGDCNGNNNVKLDDFAAIAASWQQSAAITDAANLNGDSMVDFNDLAILAGSWLQSGDSL